MRRQLFAYTRQIVSQYAHSRQTIVTEPSTAEGALDVAVWRRQAGAAEATVGVDLHEAGAAPASTPPVRIAVINDDPAALARARPIFTPFVAAESAAEADFVWDARSKDVIVASDIIARNVELDDLPGIVDRVRALADLAVLSERRTQIIGLNPDSRLHRRGDVLELEARDVQGRYAVIFNLASNGLVQLLYPLPGDPARVDAPSWHFKVSVGEPFGSDTVVALVADEPLTALGSEIAGLNDRRAAGRVAQIVRTYLSQIPSMRLGFASLFTAP